MSAASVSFGIVDDWIKTLDVAPIVEKIWEQISSLGFCYSLWWPLSVPVGISNLILIMER